jgi:hypothetical protein
MLTQFVSRLERLDNLIRTRATGSPIQLAHRLCISRSGLYNYISLLKELGAPVIYCRK